MLATDEKRLRLLGIDLHSRARRRCAVVLTYTIYLAAMVALTGGSPAWHPFAVMCSLSFVVVFLGVFGLHGPVKSFDVPKETWLSSKVMLSSLDDWTRYLCDAESFDAATEKQQQEVLKRYRVGNYLMPQKRRKSRFDRETPDEREIAIRDRASLRTLQWMASYLACIAMLYSFHPRPIYRLDAVALLWMLMVQAVTLPKAIVLWTEPDPREDEQLSLVSAGGRA